MLSTKYELLLLIRQVVACLQPLRQACSCDWIMTYILILVSIYYYFLVTYGWDRSLWFNFLDGWKGAAPGRPYVLLLDSDRIVLEWAPAIANPGSAPVAGYEASFEFNLKSLYC